MLVAHCDKPAVVQYRPGRLDIVDTDRGRVSEVIHAKRIRFKTMDPGILTKKIKTRRAPGDKPGGRLLSYIDTETEAKKLGITVEELDRFLKSHVEWNVRMIEVDEESTQVLGDSDGVGDGISEIGTGGYQCIACDKIIRDGRGLAGHKKSNAHIANLAALRGGQQAFGA